MGAVYKAKVLQTKRGTYEAACYLKDNGYSLKSALHIRLRTTERKSNAQTTASTKG